MTPQEAYDKARNLGLRTPELELVISKDSQCSYWYARNVIEGKFILGEPAISKSAYCSFHYARYVIKGKFILGEPVISKDVQFSYLYAKEIIKGRLPDLMHNQMILENNEYTKEYIKFISKNPDSLNNKI